jgi:hypothetical protein
MKDGGPAFPITPTDVAGVPLGMSLRDYFAAKAMQGWIQAVAARDHEYPGDDTISRYAYEIADAMLKAREATV